ncbi:MAG: NUDIX hydrolase [Anaerolineae bacterium]|nr:NUDIX hydrolase [Anaerolineae bacterium]
MNDAVVPGVIRPKAIGIFRRSGRILACEMYDPTKKEYFYCPPGGGIEFQETSDAALRREIKEELGTEAEHPRLLHILENIFTVDGKQGHEIVFVYAAELQDKSLYEVSHLEGIESSGIPFNAVWLDLDTLGAGTPPLYPEGLLELLRAEPLA